MIIDSRYDVIEPLGQDAWAFTYKVKDIRTNKIYALKIFKKIDAMKLYKTFHADEMHLITKLYHPNLVHVDTFGNEAESIYYTSEYFEADTLDEFELTSRTIKSFYDIIAQILFGLEAIHSQNILHQNLKPSNILFINDETGKLNVRLLDYGFIARDESHINRVVKQNQLYLAPEILAGGQPTIQSDLFSLGVTLYKVVTGHFPFTTRQISYVLKNLNLTIIPESPHYYNKNVSDKLEALILNLLEINPLNRYNNVKEILNYINHNQEKKYEISETWSLVNKIKINGYIVRKEFTEQLLKHLDDVNNGRMKTVTLFGKDGLGKNNTLSLFRYHLLSGKYFIFDYSCSEKNKDPFYALIKEFHIYLRSKKDSNTDISADNISTKFREFLFGSEEKAATINEDSKELEVDFRIGMSFLSMLSDVRPLIFIIRGGEHLTNESVEFVNYINYKLKDKRIYIIIGGNNKDGLKAIDAIERIELPALTLHQSADYINQLLNIKVPQNFVKVIWKRSLGIPYFIKYILVDLVQSQIIRRNDAFHFDTNLDDYRLNDSLKNILISRLNLLYKKNSAYESYLKRLAAANMPLTKDFILNILDDISDYDYYLFIVECVDSEVFIQRGSVYDFSFIELREYLYANCPVSVANSIALKTIEYFKDKPKDFDSLIRLVETAEFVNMHCMAREYRKLLMDYFKTQKDYSKAFHEICKVIEIDFREECNIKKRDILIDMNNLLELTEITGSIKPALEIIESIKIPDIFEKNYVIGYFYLNLDRYEEAKFYLEKASKMVFTGVQNIRISIALIKLYRFIGLHDKMKELLNSLDENSVTMEHQISIIDRKAVYLDDTNNTEKAIKLILDFIPKIKATNDYFTIMNVGSLYNNLAIFHRGLNYLEDAELYYQKAKNMWQTINHRRPLPVLYNNLGDLALIQGDTTTAKSYFDDALELSIELQQPRLQALSLVNFAEMYNKMGKYNLAKDYLLKAKKITDEIKSNSFDDSIINNMAILLLKTNNFTEYYRFIKSTYPELLENVVTSITPLTKTFFFYLLETGQNLRVKQILESNIIDFHSSHQEEFYCQIKWASNDKKNYYNEQIENFLESYDYARKNKSAYAQAIILTKLTELHLKISKISVAEDFYKRAIHIAKINHFLYWEMLLGLYKAEIDLQKPSIPIRIIIRDLLHNLEIVKENSYFLIEIKMLGLLTQIFTYLNLPKKAKVYFQNYKTKIEEVTEGLPSSDRKSFYKVTNAKLKKYQNLKFIKIAHRAINLDDENLSLLYDLLSVKSLDRIDFHLSKLIYNIFPAYKYSVISYTEETGVFQSMCKNCTDFNENFEFHDQNVRKALFTSKIIFTKYLKHNIMYVPLGSHFLKVGCLIIADNGEFEFQKKEIELIKNLRLPLTTFMIRMKEIAENDYKTKMLDKLMKISKELSYIKELPNLQKEIAISMIEFTKAGRCIFVKRNIYGNHVYDVALNAEFEVIENPAYIRKKLFIKAEETGKIQYVKSNSQQDTYEALASPILVENQVYGVLYIDNYPQKVYESMKVDLYFLQLLMDIFTTLVSQAVYYEEINNKSKEVAKFEELKRKFIMIVSHELNTPLTAIRKNIIELKSELNIDSKSISGLENKIGFLTSRIQDISTLQRFLVMDEDKLELKMEDLISIIENQVSRIEAQIPKERMIKIQASFEEDLPQLLLDRDAISTAIYHLLHNAVRYSSDNSLVIVGAKRSSFLEEEIDNQETIVFYVEDKGDGIPEDRQKYVFTSFYEGVDIASHRSGDLDYHSCSLGLGLSTVKRIVDLHHAKIWFKTKKDKGSVFYIAFPISANN